MKPLNFQEYEWCDQSRIYFYIVISIQSVQLSVYMIIGKCVIFFFSMASFLLSLKLEKLEKLKF